MRCTQEANGIAHKQTHSGTRCYYRFRTDDNTVGGRMKKMSLDDYTRLAGLIGGGSLGFGIADMVTGLDDSLNNLIDAVGGDTFEAVGGIVEQTPLSRSLPSVHKKLRRQASDHWGVVKKRHFAKLALMRVEQQIDPKKWEQMILITKGLADADYSRWYWSWYEQVETFLKKYGGSPTPDMFVPPEVKLHPRPSFSDMRPDVIQKDDAVTVPLTDGPLVQWVKDHPLHIGMTLMGAVLGEQIAQHPEVTASLLSSIGDIIPDSLEVGI